MNIVIENTKEKASNVNMPHFHVTRFSFSSCFQAKRFLQLIMASSSLQIMFIGHNSHSEFGLDDMATAADTKTLKPCKNNEFKRIFSGYAVNIFSDDTLQKLWACGCNRNGECGVGHTSTVTEYESIDYFQKNNIKLNKISMTIASECTFFISKTNELYACGEMKGLSIDDQTTPKKLPFTDVTDAQATSKCMVVLCGKNDNILSMIITNWSRLYSIPDDIIKLLLLFTRATAVFSSGNKLRSGHPMDDVLPNENGWNEIKFFKDKHITKVKSGEHHMLFLDETGGVYSCGQYDWVDGKEVYIPEKVIFPDHEDVVIRDIECGQGHSLALDVDGRVYSWGYNHLGHCGHGSVDMDNVIQPKMIKALIGYKVDVIKCGFEHSYCRTVCGKHFLWGVNSCGICTFDDELFTTKSPFRIDEIISNKYNKRIVDVVLGFYNTKIIIA